ncbi:MAG: hypothetical protein LBB56_00225 [Chitinispirillales bacterium]|jgi:DNA-damage-inducible protein D|nr:hypothetical protein [Chitinispirillales bacterium]
MSELKVKEYKRFEDIKHIRTNGGEYWSARELALVLDYTKWENFSKVLDRAMLACQNSGYKISDHFPDVRKMINIGKGGQEVRAAIRRVGGTMPENLPTPQKNIAQIEKEHLAELKRRAKKKQLMLDE